MNHQKQHTSFFFKTILNNLFQPLQSNKQQYSEQQNWAMNQDDPVGQFKRWYNRQPVFTRSYLALSVVLTIFSSLSILQVGLLYTDFETSFASFQLWRPFTSFLYKGNVGFPWIFQILICYFALVRVQTQLFQRPNYADFLWLIVYLFGGLTLAGCIIPLYFTASAFVFAMIYIWCKRKPFETIRLMFGFECKSGYFPWVFMGFNVLMGGGLWPYIAALPLAHLYIVVKDIFVPKYHKDYLATPRFFKKWIDGNNRYQAVPEARGMAPGFGGRGVRIG